MVKPKITEKVGLSFKRIVAFATWIFIAILAVSTVRNVEKVKRIRSEVQAERERLSKLEKDNQALQAEIGKSTGSEFLEKQIRDKLGLVKEGEAIVVLPDADTLKKLAPPVPSEEDTLPNPIWKRWLKLFI